jgi:zinc protease
VVDKKLYMGIADKTKIGFATQLPYQWNPRNDMALDMLAGIVDIKLTEQIRENLGGTYGTSFSLYSSHIFDPKAYMRIYLGCEPERIEELTAAIWAVIDEIIANGPTEVDLNKVKEQLCRQREVNMKENYYWTSWLCYQDNFNEPLYTLDEYKNEINSFTIEELKTAAKYMKHDNYLRFILMPGSDKKE